MYAQAPPNPNPTTPLHQTPGAIIITPSSTADRHCQGHCHTSPQHRRPPYNGNQQTEFAGNLDTSVRQHGPAELIGGQAWCPPHAGLRTPGPSAPASDTALDVPAPVGVASGCGGGWQSWRCPAGGLHYPDCWRHNYYYYDYYYYYYYYCCCCYYYYHYYYWGS